jgi:hypothetical protein
MSRIEKTIPLPTGQEVLAILHDPESDFAALVPKTIKVETLEKIFRPLDDLNSRYRIEPEARFILEQIEGNYQVSYFTDPNDSLVMRVSLPDQPLTTYLLFRDDPYLNEECVFELNNMFVASNGNAFSITHLFPELDDRKYLYFSYLVDSEDGETADWSADIDRNAGYLGLVHNKSDLNALLHEFGHLWAEYFDLNQCEFQDLVRWNDFYRRKNLTNENCLVSKRFVLLSGWPIF